MKIRYKPVEELVILEMVEYNIDDLAQMGAIFLDIGRPIILNWSEGVAFHHIPLPFNPKELLKERKQGKIYWASLIYTSMPEYMPRLKIGAREIPVVRTPNPLLRQVALWIKDQMMRN